MCVRKYPAERIFGRSMRSSLLSSCPGRQRNFFLRNRLLVMGSPVKGGEEFLWRDGELKLSGGGVGRKPRVASSTFVSETLRTVTYNTHQSTLTPAFTH